MPLRITTGTDNAPLGPLLDRTVAVLGFGNQGAAHALNLRDSGVTVVVGNRPDTANACRAGELGFEVVTIEAATKAGHLIIIALPDEVQGDVWRAQIAPRLRVGATVGFLHGFAIHHRLIEPEPEVGVIMVAPKGPGRTLRMRYERGEGIPCLLAVHQDSPADNAEALGLAWANGIGCARAGIIHTTFAAETETDLFGEQAVLCGGMTWLILAAFETLVDAGYPPELAYLECCHEAKQVADLVYERGLAGMMAAVSNTAEFGAQETGPKLVDEDTRQKMRDILDDIRSGAFARRLGEDHRAGFEWFNEQRRRLSAHQIEQAGTAVRALMPWLATDESS